MSGSGGDSVGFDFDEGVGVDELGDFNDGGGGADIFEDFAVDDGDFFPLGNIGDVHAGADDVGDFSAEGFDGALDDVEGSPGLGADVGRVGLVSIDADGA